jgi:hypothetical protein
VVIKKEERSQSMPVGEGYIYIGTGHQVLIPEGYSKPIKALAHVPQTDSSVNETSLPIIVVMCQTRRICSSSPLQLSAEELQDLQVKGQPRYRLE